MKQIHYPLLALIIQLVAADSYAILRTDVPKPKLTLTEAQINAIKHERGRPSKDSLSEMFADDNSEELEELLQVRLREVSHLTYFRDHTSLDKVLTFSGLALQAWNPELRYTDTKKMVIKNIVNYGFIDGFVVPTMAMMNASYAIGNNGFGTLMNVMLADAVPNLAENFRNQYGVPTEINNQNFDQISNQGRSYMWTALMSQLDPDFYSVHNETEKMLIDARLKSKIDSANNFSSKEITSKDQFDIYGATKEYDPQTKEVKINDFINVNINGDRTAIGTFLKKIGKTDKSALLMSKRKLFASDLSDSTKECAWKCITEIADSALTYAGNGSLFSKSIYAKLGGAVIGAAHGADNCRASAECGGSKEQTAAEKAQKEAIEKTKAAETKKAKETMDKINSELDAKDKEKQRRAQEMKEEYDRHQKEQQEQEKSEEQDDNEDSNIERDIKPMLEEDGNKTTHEDIQNMKKQQGMPKMPDENSSGYVFTLGRKDFVVKANVKEKNAENKQVNAIYPTNPGLGN